MDALTATPTEHGLSVLNTSLKTTATRYKIFGADTYDATTTEAFYSGTIESSFYDSNGVLTFQVELPIENHFNKYMHSVVITDTSDQVILAVSTPKSALASGIGGFLTIKCAVTGQAGEVVFKASDYVTLTELKEKVESFDLDAATLGGHDVEHFYLPTKSNRNVVTYSQDGGLRRENVTYYNTQDRTIFVFVQHETQFENDRMEIYLGGSVFYKVYGNNSCVGFYVPPGAAYFVYLPHGSSSLARWIEYT